MSTGGLAVRWAGRHAVVSLPEEIDLANASDVHAGLLDVTKQDAQLITADLTGTMFCDSAGIHVITRVHQEAGARGGELRLAVGDSPVARILELTGLDQIIRVFPGVQQSLDTPRAQPDGAPGPAP